MNALKLWLLAGLFLPYGYPLYVSHHQTTYGRYFLIPVWSFASFAVEHLFDVASQQAKKAGGKERERVTGRLFAAAATVAVRKQVFCHRP